MRRTLFLAACVLALVAGTACGDVNPYAAKVNGDRIAVDELNRELKAVRGNKQYLDAVKAQFEQQGESPLGTGTDTFGSEFVAQTLTRRIYFKLVHQEVVRRKLKVTDDAVKQARDSMTGGEGGELYKDFPKKFLDEIAYSTAEVNVLQENLQSEVTDESVQQFYNENPQFFVQYCARQIVTGGFSGDAPPPADQEAAAKAAADSIKARLATGGDFAAIAKAESKDPRTAPNGGDLGCVAANAFPPEAQAAMEGAKPGDVVGPIRTDTGFYVIQLQSTATQPLAEVADQIRQYLQQQAGDPLTQFLQKALADAKVEVNPRYGKFDTQLPQPRVVPPDAPVTETTTPAPEDLVPGGGAPEGGAPGGGAPEGGAPADQ
ncbi:MAG TPA: peptidylprolyl isomerase [Acidimicrobiales bacterium]